MTETKSKSFVYRPRGNISNIGISKEGDHTTPVRSESAIGLD